MVTHTSWLFLTDATLRRRQLLEVDWLALLLSAICHDLEHPGTTNAYQVNTGSALALRYNDASVLENHHCCVGFAAMERNGILKCLDAATLKALRKLFVAAVLATDMSVHKDLLARVGARATAEAAPSAAGGGPAPPAPSGNGAVGKPGVGDAPPCGFSRDSPEDRQLLVSFLLHCADLCNPLLPPPVSRRIANELSMEFSRQAELERAASLPVTVMLAHDDVGKAKLELGFLEYVVAPLYKTLSTISPVLGNRCLALIEENRAAWSEIIASDTDADHSSRHSNGADPPPAARR